MALQTTQPTLISSRPARNEKLDGNGYRTPGAAAEEPKGRRQRLRRTTSHVTLDGALFVMLMSFIFICAVNTNANLLYLVFSMLLATLILCWMIGWVNLRQLTMHRVYPVEFHAGYPVEGWIEIENSKRRWYSYALRVRDMIVGPMGNPRTERIAVRGFVVQVPRRGRGRALVEIMLPRRGLYTLQEATVVSRFPFGVLERTLHQSNTQKILVLPRLLPTMAMLPFVPRTIGEVETDQRGMGYGVYGVRDYQRGDPARIIHWKHSARGQGMKVKEFEHEESRGYRLMLDLHMPPASGTAQEEDFEKAVSVAASMARMLLRRNAEVGLWTSMGNVPVSGGPEHLMRLLRALAQVQPILTDEPGVPPAGKGVNVDDIWIEYLPGGRSGGAGNDEKMGPRNLVIDARRVQVIDSAAPALAKK